jgi:hypothetical protein
MIVGERNERKLDTSINPFKIIGLKGKLESKVSACF